MDAAFGPGWYLTDLPPSTSAQTVVRNNWRANVGKARARCYLEFDIDPSLLTRTGEHNYLVRKWDDKGISFIGGGCRTAEGRAYRRLRA
jgi:hypothetical protein